MVFNGNASNKYENHQSIPHICHFFTQAKFLENKIYTKKTRKLRQNTQKIANFLRYYGKIHSKLPIFRVKSVKIYTGQKNLHENSRGFRDKFEVCTPNIINYNAIGSKVFKGGRQQKTILTKASKFVSSLHRKIIYPFRIQVSRCIQ